MHEQHIEASENQHEAGILANARLPAKEGTETISSCPSDLDEISAAIGPEIVKPTENTAAISIKAQEAFNDVDDSTKKEKAIEGGNLRCTNNGDAVKSDNAKESEIQNEICELLEAKAAPIIEGKYEAEKQIEKDEIIGERESITEKTEITPTDENVTSERIGPMGLTDTGDLESGEDSHTTNVLKSVNGRESNVKLKEHEENENIKEKAPMAALAIEDDLGSIHKKDISEKDTKNQQENQHDGKNTTILEQTDMAENNSKSTAANKIEENKPDTKTACENAKQINDENMVESHGYNVLTLKNNDDVTVQSEIKETDINLQNMPISLTEAEGKENEPIFSTSIQDGQQIKENVPTESEAIKNIVEVTKEENHPHWAAIKDSENEKVESVLSDCILADGKIKNSSNKQIEITPKGRESRSDERNAFDENASSQLDNMTKRDANEIIWSCPNPLTHNNGAIDSLAKLGPNSEEGKSEATQEEDTIPFGEKSKAEGEIKEALIVTKIEAKEAIDQKCANEQNDLESSNEKSDLTYPGENNEFSNAEELLKQPNEVESSENSEKRDETQTSDQLDYVTQKDANEIKSSPHTQIGATDSLTKLAPNSEEAESDLPQEKNIIPSNKKSKVEEEPENATIDSKEAMIEPPVVKKEEINQNCESQTKLESSSENFDLTSPGENNEFSKSEELLKQSTEVESSESSEKRGDAQTTNISDEKQLAGDGEDSLGSQFEKAVENDNNETSKKEGHPLGEAGEESLGSHKKADVSPENCGKDLIDFQDARESSEGKYLFTPASSSSSSRGEENTVKDETETKVSEMGAVAGKSERTAKIEPSDSQVEVSNKKFITPKQEVVNTTPKKDIFKEVNNEIVSIQRSQSRSSLALQNELQKSASKSRFLEDVKKKKEIEQQKELIARLERAESQAKVEEEMNEKKRQDRERRQSSIARKPINQFDDAPKKLDEIFGPVRDAPVFSSSVYVDPDFDPRQKDIAGISETVRLKKSDKREVKAEPKKEKFKYELPAKPAKFQKAKPKEATPPREATPPKEPTPEPELPVEEPPKKEPSPVAKSPSPPPLEEEVKAKSVEISPSKILPPKIGINGFNGVGRLVLRAAIESGLEVKAINDPFVPLHYMVYMLKFDIANSNSQYHGKEMSVREGPTGQLVVNGKAIHVYAEHDVTKIPWELSGVNYVVEATEALNSKAEAGLHLRKAKKGVRMRHIVEMQCESDDPYALMHGGCKKVIIAGPSPDAPLVVIGLNDELIDKGSSVISHASAPASALAPVLSVLHRKFVMKSCSYTLLKSIRGRSKDSVKCANVGPSSHTRSVKWDFSENLVPTQFPSFDEEMLRILPFLHRKFHGICVYVPTPEVSMIDVTVQVENGCGENLYRDACLALKEAAEEPPLKTVLRYCMKMSNDNSASSLFASETHSSVVDAKSGCQINDDTIKLVIWFDNETGHAYRIIDLVTNFHVHYDE